MIFTSVIKFLKINKNTQYMYVEECYEFYIHSSIYTLHINLLATAGNVLSFSFTTCRNNAGGV